MGFLDFIKGETEPKMEKGTLIIPKGIDSIPDSKFKNRSDIKKVVFEGNVKSIGRYAFHGCRNLMEIEFPKKLEFIGDNAFSYTGLREIVLPEKVKKIENRAFQGNESLTDVTFNCVDVELGEAIFSNNVALIKLKLSNGITEIPKYFCKGCVSLESVVIPNSVKYIENEAFSECDRLNSIALPNNLLKIGSLCFMDCRSLTSVEVPGSIKVLKHGTFKRCDSLWDIKINEGISEIEKYCFYGCSKLSDIQIPKSLIHAEQDIFYDCNSLTTVYVNDCNRDIIVGNTSLTQKVAYLNPSTGSSTKSISSVDDALSALNDMCKDA